MYVCRGGVIFRNGIIKYSGILFRNIPEYSGIFRNIPENIPEYSGIQKKGFQSGKQPKINRLMLFLTNLGFTDSQNHAALLVL
jgi:hypothetical protein